MVGKWLFLCLAGAMQASAAPLRSPGEAVRAGQPALLTEATAKEWLAWKGAAVLGFFHPSQKGMGLKALAQEYKGRLPLGGVRADDTAIQRMFNVDPLKDLPLILVLQSGTASMRLGGGSNQATLKTLINSALMSAAPPPPPTAAETRKRTSASTVRVDCAQIKGPCLLLVGSGAPADKLSDMLGENALRVDNPTGGLARALGYDSHTMGAAALYVVKGNSRPRLARFTSTRMHDGSSVDRAALSKFFTDLQEGALSFTGWAWPTAADEKRRSDSGTGSGNGGRTDGSRQAGNDSSSSSSSSSSSDARPERPRSHADLSAGQYLESENGDQDETEVIELEDDEE